MSHEFKLTKKQQVFKIVMLLLLPISQVIAAYCIHVHPYIPPDEAWAMYLSVAIIGFGMWYIVYMVVGIAVGYFKIVDQDYD